MAQGSRGSQSISGRNRGRFSRWALAVLAPAARAATPAAAHPSHTDVEAALAQSRLDEKFDCGRNWWEAVTAFLGGDWPEEKKEWCCQHRKVGCESKSSKPSDEVQYDCQEGYSVRDQAWSKEKRDWCCDHERLGCKTDAWNAEPYNCHTDQENWREQWSRSKQAWCCEFEGQGCQGPHTTTTTERFDCLTDLLHWQTRWTSERQEWCCGHHGRGCHSTSRPDDRQVNSTEDSPQPEFDCTVGFSHWEDTWSRGKQAWCCDGRAKCESRKNASEAVQPGGSSNASNHSTSLTRHTSVSPSSTSLVPRTTTVTTTTDELYDCRLGVSDWPEKWTGWKKEWCCDRHGVGCPPTSTLTTSTSKPYDCLEGVATWEESWPAAKKRWCCKHELRGCTACDVACVVAGFPASCRNRIEWLEAHNLNWMANGCTRARHVVLEECPACRQCQVSDTCPGVVNLTRYDCEAGRENLEKGWSQSKKDWCCSYFDVGCPPTTTTTTTVTTTTAPYDCSAGVHDWEANWSSEKRAWCCKRRGIGCTSCDASCVVDGLAATCRDRVGWLLGHVMRNQEDACAHAHGLVLDQCPTCASCKKADTCPSETDEAATTTTSLPFNCQAGLNNWRLGWSEVKREWCCRNEELGCGGDGSQDSGDKYNCQVGLRSWSHEKTDWCCTHRQLGCSLLASSTSTTEVTVSEEEDQFDCQDHVLDWAHKWSQKKKEWCCWRYSVGCAPTLTESSRTGKVASLRWVARDSLPNQQGETLEGYSQTLGGLDKMKEWCEEHSDCVGFAMQPESLKWYPKKVGTGFDALTAKWNADKWRGQAWRWYYIEDRGAASLPKASGKFELLPRSPPGRNRPVGTHQAEQALALFSLACLAVAAGLAAVRAGGSGSAQHGEDGLITYLALDPANQETRSHAHLLE